jgi:hypothetical protein
VKLILAKQNRRRDVDLKIPEASGTPGCGRLMRPDPISNIFWSIMAEYTSEKCLYYKLMLWFID